MELNDTVIVRLLGNRDEKAFEQVFKTHFKSLHGYAFSIVKDEVAAEEMVQNVFYKIWEKADQLNITAPIAAYLYRSVYNESLNYIKHQKVKSVYKAHKTYEMKDETDSASKKVLLGELENNLRVALNDLPEQCRTIFQLSRFDELRYREIADKLGISVKTVENQMGKALRILRLRLADFLPLIVLTLLNIK
ncbi:MAG: RNA polymerase sigma-70 factor [Gemmatimonadaceae bacterium]|nr:RNA polymerase sigma-70 factor [Chitinophagaceae bacterium]